VDRLSQVVFKAGAEATRTAVIEATREARVLHIACHGEFHPYQPTSSQLLLTPEAGSDGVLSAADLAKQDLSNCRMLALTGCETAIGSAAGADDLAGFPRAAFEAGCQAILGTLWPVEDSSAGRLVASLVEATDGRKGPAEVLREACSDRRADPRDRDPSAWSGWVLVENGW
jgi:CHAT domain-containing protein